LKSIFEKKPAEPIKKPVFTQDIKITEPKRFEPIQKPTLPTKPIEPSQPTSTQDSENKVNSLK